MKIGITTFGGDGGKSGISRYIVNLLQEFSRIESEFEFEILVYEDEKEIFLKGIDNVSYLTFSKRISPPVINIAWHQLSLGRLCQERQYDLIFLPAGNRRLSFSLPCHAVGTVHDLSSLHVEGKYSKFRQLYIFKILPSMVKRLSKIITVSESSKKDIRNFMSVPENKIVVTPLAADNQMYYPRSKEVSFNQLKSKYKLQAPFLLYIARIEHPGKNHVRLLEAFNILKKNHLIPHQLVLVGSDWNRAEVVHQFARESEFTDDIVFTGFVPDADLPFFYTACDLFLFPSLYEGFGLPILEAMISDVPVACSNLSSLPEVAGNGALLFDPASVESIVESILAILFDDAKKNSLIKKGKQRGKMYSWENTALRTLDVFRDVCKAHNS